MSQVNMKIAVLSYSFLPKLGGGEIVVSRLASYLSKKGNTVFIISNCKGFAGTPKNYIVYQTPRLCCESISRIAHLLVAPFMLLFIHLMNRIDVVQAAGLTDLFVALPIRLIFRVPIVLRLVGWKRLNIIKRLKKVVSVAADVIVTVNSNLRAELSKGGFSENQIVTIYNGVNINKFRPSSANRGKIVMLWVGKLDSHKRAHLAIETLSFVKGTYKNLCLQIVGQGCMEEQLRELVSKYDLQESVRFLGYQSHNKVAEIMRNADIFLITSKSEGMSNALLEAMACGMAVVATYTSAISVIQNGVNGFIANYPEEMASVVSRLVDDDVLRRKIGEQARRTVLEKFSADRMFYMYSQLYKKLTRK